MSKIKEVLNSQLRNKKKLPLQAKEHERRKHNRLKKRRLRTGTESRRS